MFWLVNLLGIRTAERERLRALMEGPGGPAAQLAVGGVVLATALRAQRRAAHRLTAGCDAVSVTAAGAAAMMVCATERPGLADRLAAVEKAEAERLAVRFDRAVPVIDERWITVAEIVILAFEWTFWFATWSRPIERSAPWFGPDRIAAALLALVTPVLGIYGARLGGGHLHRVLHGEASRFERAGAVAGTGLAAAAVVVIGWLGYWRFAAGAGIGAVVPPPTALALLFGLVIVLDLLLRVFGVSQFDQQRRRRHRDVVREREAAAASQVQVLAAQHHARAAWLRLRRDVHLLLDRVDLIAARGDELILDTHDGDGAGLDGVAVAAAMPAHAGGGTGYRLPSGLLQRVLHGDHHVPFELRLIADAVNVLAAHPPPGTTGAEQMVDDLRARMPEPAAPADLPEPTPIALHRPTRIRHGFALRRAGTLGAGVMGAGVLGGRR